MRYPRKTKIVCTIGPAVEEVGRIGEMLAAGMNIARINFSHGTREGREAMMAMVREAERRSGIPVAIMMDTKGPEIRTGAVAEGTALELRVGMEVTLTTAPMVAVATADGARLSISYGELPRLVKAGGHIYVADGMVDLCVRRVRVREGEIVTVVRSGGTIGSHKNVNVPGVSLPFPPLSEGDARDIVFGLRQGVDFIAASFIRGADDVLHIRRLVERNSEDRGIRPRIIAKIENEEGVRNIREIAEIADGVMIARGDLGVQLPMERIPLVQKHILEHCNGVGTPVVTATQMLESMVSHPRPTRAEMTDVANAIFDGTDAVMLSGETAVGRYPIQSIETLNRIALAVENAPEFIARGSPLVGAAGGATGGARIHCSSDAIAKSSCLLARDIGVSCIVIPTVRGNGPRFIARYRAPFPIIAATPSDDIVRQLLLYWGIIPLLVGQAQNTEEMLENAMRIAKKSGYVREGEWVVTVAGLPLESPITLNTVSAKYIGKVLKRGRRAYGGMTSGRIVVAREGEGDDGANGGSDGESHSVSGEGGVGVGNYSTNRGSDGEGVARADEGGGNDGAGGGWREAIDSDTILVLERLTEAHMDMVRGARGVISERINALTPSQVRAQNPHMVVIEEVEQARSFFQDGQRVHINGLEKTVYEN